MSSLEKLLSVLCAETIKLAARGVTSLALCLKCSLNIWCLLLPQMATKQEGVNKDRKDDKDRKDGIGGGEQCAQHWGRFCSVGTCPWLDHWRGARARLLVWEVVINVAGA